MSNFIELGTTEVKALKWLMGNTPPKKQQTPAVFRGVHMNILGGLETYNDQDGDKAEVRSIYSEDQGGRVTLTDRLLSGIGIDEIAPGETYPSTAILFDGIGSTTTISGALIEDECIDYEPDAKGSPTFALNPRYLRGLLDGFDGQVEVMIQDGIKPLSFRGKTKAGKLAYVVLMPMHLGKRG